MPHDIIVVDDEKDIRDLIKDILEDESYSVRLASNSTDVFRALEEKIPNVIILDIWLQGSELDGLGILELVKKNYPFIPVIMISGHGTIESAVNSIKSGAYDYIEKPFDEDKLLILVKRACEAGKLVKENKELKLKFNNNYKLIGESSKINNLRTYIDKVANLSSRILITGPSGSGKKLVARLIHKKSFRNNESFITFSAAGLSDERAKIELLGEIKNSKDRSFSNLKIGALELANNGTLFIDEITDFSLDTQKILLNFIQNSNIIKSNGKTVKLDVRIIASTTQNITKLIEQNKFRADLYYRINVVNIPVPALSERKDDIPLLCKYFLNNFDNKINSNIELSIDAMAILQSYDWPGNVRQLKNALEWSFITNAKCKGLTIEVNHLPSEILAGNTTIVNPESENDIMSLSLKEARELFEKQYLKAQLNRFNGNITKMSEKISMERSALHRKLKNLGICSKDENK